jgi:hypothetical protein
VTTADQTTSSPSAAAALAAAPPPVATPARPAVPSSVAQQIDDFIHAAPVTQLPPDAASGVVAGGADEPRKVHGVVDVSVGNHGYRSGYVRSDLPIGKTGTLSIAVGETQFNGRASPYGYRYGNGGGSYTSQTLAIGLALGQNSAPSGEGRCRSAWNDNSRFGLDTMMPVAADRFASCPYASGDGPDDR